MKGRFGRFDLKPYNSACWSLTVCNVELDHENDSVIKQTLKKCGCLISVFGFFKCHGNQTFGFFRFVDVGSVRFF